MDDESNKKALGFEKLAACGGCDITFLDIGERLLEVFETFDILYTPNLMDWKYFGPVSERDYLELPNVDFAVVSGGVRTEEQKEILKKVRKNSQFLVALGACATHGGIPALGNMTTISDIMDCAFRTTQSTEPEENPNEDLPDLTDRIYALDEVVKVDLDIPGCPTNPDLVYNALMALNEGTEFEMQSRSVCDECPTRREKKAAAGASIKRPLESLEVDYDNWDNTRCFMEQGFLCIGPITRAGCGTAEVGGTTLPRCISGYMPCRGCFGPVNKGSNPLVDMMSALSSIGFNARDIEDRKGTLLRYTGAHNLLRPIPLAGPSKSPGPGPGVPPRGMP
jgi:F420-non-reducing hydrogenase small subunit